MTQLWGRSRLQGLNLATAFEAWGELDLDAEEPGRTEHFDVHEFSRTANLKPAAQADLHLPSSPNQTGFLEPAQVNSGIPTGYRVLEEEDRLVMLDTLKEKLADLNVKYTHLPLRLETVGQCNVQKDLRQKISEAETAIKLFSRPGLLIEK